MEILKLISSLGSSNKQKNLTKSNRLRAEHREIKLTLRGLASELHKTREELQVSQRENARKDQRLKDLQEENGKLIAQLKGRTGLYPVK
jgi:outer membrane murein-binding lipoprotein Lpp